MSLASRTVRRGGRVIFKAASTTREPLLFLYPRFVATVAAEQTKSHPKDNVTSSEIHTNAIYPPQNANADQEQTLRIRENLSEGNQGRKKTTDSIVPFDDFLKKADDSPIEIKRVIAVHKAKVEKRVAKEEYEDMTRQIYQAERKTRLGIENEDIDWRRIYSLLFEHTHRVSEISTGDGEKVVVPSTSVETLLYHVDDNIWKIMGRTHCNIHFLDGHKTTDETRTLLLTGRPKYVSWALEEIQRIVPNCSFNSSSLNSSSLSGASVFGANVSRTNTVPIDSISLQKDSFPPIEDAIAAGKGRSPRLDITTPPTKWTKIAFYYHVLHVTRAKKVNFPNEASAGSSSETHVDRVRNHLNLLFQDPNLQDFISVYAFNIGLSYFVKIGQVKDARRLFVLMEMQGLEMNTETFNIMLRGCAKVHDLHNYGFILGIMLKRRHLPDAGTWFAFLSTLTNFDVKIQVISAMRKKGLLRHIGAIDSLCREVSPLEAQWSIMKQQTHEEFIRHMDERYGPHWLSTVAANRIMDQLAICGFISRCCQLARFMASRWVRPNQISLRTVISHCRTLENLDGAIHTLRIFSGLGVEPDAGTYQDLFFMAMELRLYSFARVVWRYACLDHRTTYPMRTALETLSSLWISPESWRAAIPRGSISNAQLWRQTVGKVILGNGTTLGGHPAATARKGMVKNPSLRLSSNRRSQTPQWISKDKDYAVIKSKVWTHTQICLDLAIHKDWAPSSTFAEMLDKAYRQDMDWKKEGVQHKTSLMWMLNRAITVPITRKTKKNLERASGWTAVRTWN